MTLKKYRKNPARLADMKERKKEEEEKEEEEEDEEKASQTTTAQTNCAIFSQFFNRLVYLKHFGPRFMVINIYLYTLILQSCFGT